MKPRSVLLDNLIIGTMIYMVLARKTPLDKPTYYLPFMPESQIKVSVNPVDAVLYKYPTHVPGHSYYREKYTSYCYTSLMGDISCEDKLEPVPADIDELQKWKDSGKCLVGKSCHPSFQCWGSDAALCKSIGGPMDLPGRPKFLHASSPLPKSLYHTCTVDWKCNHAYMNFPTHLVDKDGTILLATADSSGIDVFINATNMGKTFTTTSGDFLYLEPVSTTPTVEMVKAQCASPLDTTVICVLTPGVNGGGGSTVFNINPSTFIGTQDNFGLKVKTPIHSFLPDNSKTILYPGKKRMSNTMDVEEAASLESLSKTLAEVQLNAIEMLYNTMAQLREMTAVKNAVRTIIETVSKSHPDLICNLRNMSCQTRWFNNHLFEVIQSNTLPSLEYTNCHTGMIYKNGGMSPAQQNDRCYSLDQNSTHPFNLWDASEYFLPKVDPIIPASSSSSWSGWISMHERDVPIDETIGDDISSISGQTLFTGYGSLWSVVLPYFQTTINIIGTLGFILHFLKK